MRIRMAAWCVLAPFCLSVAGVAEETVAPLIPEIVVTPSRVARDVGSEPSTVYRVSGAEQNVGKARRTTPDVLSGIPSVFVQKTSYGQGSPFLRGFTGFRTLFLIDGIRLNNSVFRDGPNQYWNTVDPLSIADYELVMGPASVLYGSDAIGGTLNALPLAPPPEWETRLHVRAATADESLVGRLQIGGPVNDRLSVVAGASLKDFNDLAGGQDVGTQEHTGYDEQDFDARADYALDDDSTLTLAHQTVDQDDAWRTHRTIYGTDWEGLTNGGEKVHSLDQHRNLTYLRYRGTNLAGFAQNIECTVSRQVQSEDQYRVKKDSTSDKQGFDVTTWGASVQLDSETPAGELVYGAEYYRDSVDSYSRKFKADGSLDKVEIQGPVADDATYDSVGAYVQDTLSLLDGHLDVTPGVRYTYASANADRVKDPLTGKAMSVEDDWDAVVGSLRFLVPLSADRRHVAYASVSQGFRAPNLSDLTRLDIARSGELETPVTDLDPEEFIAYEVGLRSRFEHLESQASFYYTTLDGMIVRAPTGRTVDDLLEVTKKNSGDGCVQGLELSETWHLSREWSVWATASWIDGEVDAYPTSAAEEKQDYISRLMPLTADVGVRWQAEDTRYWFEIEGAMADEADKLSAEDERDTQRIPPGGTPGYAVCNLRTGAKVGPDLDLTVALENVFDKDYRIHGSGVNEPGRNLVLAAEYRF